MSETHYNFATEQLSDIVISEHAFVYQLQLQVKGVLCCCSADSAVSAYDARGTVFVS